MVGGDARDRGTELPTVPCGQEPVPETSVSEDDRRQLRGGLPIGIETD